VSALSVTRNEKTISGALALGMHLLFALLLIFGVAWQQQRSDTPVVVDLWSNLPPVPQPKAEAPPQVKPEPPPPKPKPAPKVEPKAEPKPLPKPDIALKEKAEKERKKKKAEERQKAEAKKSEEEKKKEAERKAQKEKELAEAKRLEKEREEALRKLAAQQAARASAQQRLIDDYKRRISDKIRRFVVLPPNLQGNPEAEFDVVQIPGGEVLSVKLKRTSGNSAYDAAVERAIHKAQPLPPPPDGFTFSEFRELNLKFRPKE
jgi:colicin import membrane protein